MATVLRYAASVIGAALAASLAGSLPWLSPTFAFYAFVAALAHAAILGLPAALVLLRLRRDGLITALLAGFVIGSAPCGFVAAADQLAGSLGGAVGDVAHSAEIAPWRYILTMTGFCGACGAIGGFAAWGIWRASARAPALLLGAVGVAVAAAYVVIAGPLPFVQQWWEAQEGRWNDRLRVRNRMADGLLLSHRLIGKSKGDIVRLLGEPPPTVYFREWDMAYDLGEERSLFAIDSEWLVIRLDDNGVATEARLTVD